MSYSPFLNIFWTCFFVRWNKHLLILLKNQMGRPQCTDILSYLRIFSLFATVFSTGTSLVVNILQMICWPVFLSFYFEHLLESGIGKKKKKKMVLVFHFTRHWQLGFYHDWHWFSTSPDSENFVSTAADAPSLQKFSQIKSSPNFQVWNLVLLPTNDYLVISHLLCQNANEFENLQIHFLATFV